MAQYGFFRTQAETNHLWCLIWFFLRNFIFPRFEHFYSLDSCNYFVCEPQEEQPPEPHPVDGRNTGRMDFTDCRGMMFSGLLVPFRRRLAEFERFTWCAPPAQHGQSPCSGTSRPRV